MSVPACGRTLRVAAIVLAAGEGRRFGEAGKLLSPFRGRPLASHAVDAALASRASPVVVVTGHRGAELQRSLSGRAVRWVHNEGYRAGLSGSLRVGLSALSQEAEAALICLGDMPHVQAAHLDLLIDAFSATAGSKICAPFWSGRRGNPVLWPARHFASLGALTGDRGARDLLDALADQVLPVAMPDDAVLYDVDTPADA